MLTDTKLKHLKAREKNYKIADRDGLYVLVTPAGSVTFRYDYRINNRRETLTIGRYGPGGVNLAKAREKLMEAKKLIATGISPAIKKQQAKQEIRNALSFREYEMHWRKTWNVAESTRALRLSIMDKEVLPHFGKRTLKEISPTDLRILCEQIRDRGAPSTALNVRHLVSKVFEFAIDRGIEVDSSGICRYAITTIILQNGDRSVTIMPEQVIRGSEKGCVTMSITVPDSLSGARIFHLSMAPEAGWYIRRGHQSAKENILMTEDCFFQSIDCLA